MSSIARQEVRFPAWCICCAHCYTVNAFSATLAWCLDMFHLLSDCFSAPTYCRFAFFVLHHPEALSTLEVTGTLRPSHPCANSSIACKRSRCLVLARCLLVPCFLWPFFHFSRPLYTSRAVPEVDSFALGMELAPLHDSPGN